MIHEVGKPVVFEPDLELEKENALEAVDAFHAETLDHLTGDATQQEQATWSRKALAAERFLAGTATEKQTKMLVTEATLTGDTAENLANYIIDAAGDTDELIGLASGLRRKSRDAIKAASSFEELQAAITAAQTEGNAAIEQILNGKS